MATERSVLNASGSEIASAKNSSLITNNLAKDRGVQSAQTAAILNRYFPPSRAAEAQHPLQSAMYDECALCAKGGRTSKQAHSQRDSHAISQKLAALLTDWK